MDETYRMLGREHQADLEREAQKRRLASVASGEPARARRSGKLRQRRRPRLIPARLAALLR
jgi:hypothetical protein